MKNKLVFVLATAVCLSFLTGCKEKPFDHEAALKNINKNTQTLQRYFNSKANFTGYTDKILNMSSYSRVDEFFKYAKANSFVEVKPISKIIFDDTLKQEVNIYGSVHKVKEMYEFSLSNYTVTAAWYSRDTNPEISDYWKMDAVMRMVLDDKKIKKDLIVNEYSADKIPYDITSYFRLYKWYGNYKYIYCRRGGGTSSGTYKIFGINEKGEVTKFLELGGWHSEIAFIDLDNDSLPEIVFNVDAIPYEVRKDIPKELVEADSKYPMPTPLTFANMVQVFKWKNDKFENVGEYYTGGLY
ncbi:MAG: hypothetical protein A2231_07815 [Candidatus Firestonebacteria bacterium RIFOXYA2_FULL_40_8]|nr:MAG: hypothetical protein A2231_07815 [Candidatus Firestonebacteria bacterium RIFOXYA2_FULL_40_8]